MPLSCGGLIVLQGLKYFFIYKGVCMYYLFGKEKTKEETIRERLGKCGHCPFLHIRDAENEKVYCFYQWKGKCILGLSE